jgi:hypothetical protein
MQNQINYFYDFCEKWRLKAPNFTPIQ